MKQIIPGFETIPKREVIDCHINTFRYTLNYYGIDIDSFTLFVLSGALGFQYGQFLFPRLDNFKFWFAGALVLDFEEKLMKNMRISYRKLVIDGDEKGINALVRYVNRGIPLLFLFDGRYIPESNMGFTRNALKLNLNYPSIAALVGHDLAEEEFYITLSGNDENTELYRFKIDDFIKSRSEKSFPVSPDNICYELNIDDGYREMLKHNLKSFIEEVLLETCRRMLQPDLQFSIPDLETIPLEYYQGVLAMRMFDEKCREYIEEILVQETRDLTAKQKLDKMFIVNFMIFRTFFANGSYTCFRREFGTGLKNISQLVNCRPLDGVGNEFLELADNWRAFVRMLYYVKDYLQDKNGFARLIHEKVMYLAGMEERLFNEIIRALG